MELISVALRHTFREVCSTIILRQIDDMFHGCGIQQKELTWEVLSQISGERRARVERYYASLDWTKPADAQKFLNVISFALSQEYVSQKYKDQLRHLCINAGFQVNGDVVTLPAQEQKHAPSNSISTNSQQEKQMEKRTVNPERKISAITRRDIIDKLGSLKIEGRLDLIEFLRMTWPELDSMRSPDSQAPLKDDIIRHIYTFPDWEYDYLLYKGLKLGDCDDKLFTSFLASCLHPLVRPGKKEVAELLSFFNEALHPDGYVLRLGCVCKTLVN